MKHTKQQRAYYGHGHLSAVSIMELEAEITRLRGLVAYCSGCFVDLGRADISEIILGLLDKNDAKPEALKMIGKI